MGGYACGYAMGVLTTFALSYLVMLIPADGRISTIVDPGVSRVLLAVPIFIGASMGWGLIGLMAGFVYEVGGLHDQQDMLGSPSGVFTIMMAVIAWIPVLPLVMLFRSQWWVWVSLSGSFAVLFGWVLPHLAGQ
ncbi:MAG TPA: hypothetical protein VFK32_02555 [Tepidiformaceae bacterium]|nr:hypothetical protein [Tepidiformaceae bacterium]